MSNSSQVSGLSEACGARLSWVEVSQESQNNNKKTRKIDLLKALVGG